MVTIAKFQELYLIYLMDLPDFEKSFKLVQVYLGASEDEVDSLPLGKFNAICRELNELFEFRESEPVNKVVVNGRHYRLNLDIAKMSAGRYVEAVTFSENLIPNLHKIMATIAQPCTWWGKALPYDAREHEQYADDMLQVDFRLAYTAAVFFYQVFGKSIKSLSSFLIAEAVKMGANREEAQKTMADLSSILDGFIPLKQLPKWSEQV